MKTINGSLVQAIAKFFRISIQEAAALLSDSEIASDLMWQ
jgi:hypothetical protein